jgi:hypothetical protein
MIIVPSAPQGKVIFAKTLHFFHLWQEMHSSENTKALSFNKFSRQSTGAQS